MNRTVTAILSLFLAAGTMSVAVAPAFAGRGAPDYRVTTVDAVKGVKIANETLWRCANNICVADSAPSRPEIVCAKVAREIGKLDSFSFRGATFDADALAKCNTRAR